MLRTMILSMGMVLATFLSQPAHAGDILPAGKKLAETLDAMNVEKLWLAKTYVNWKTGESLDKPVTDNRSHTHCSAFVASACMKMDVYILRPPEHTTTLLANAQFDWLQKEGPQKGWEPVKTGLQAQQFANEGKLVVAVFKEADPKKPGHIAIVRPSTKSDKLIEEEGPQVIQAGQSNYNSTSLKEGFKHHAGAMKPDGVHYFMHELKLK